MVNEWESQKPLAEFLEESTLYSNRNRINSTRNMNDTSDNAESEEQKVLKDYSGVILQLRDLYQVMAGNVSYDKLSDFQIDIKPDAVVEKIENEM